MIHINRFDNIIRCSIRINIDAEDRESVVADFFVYRVSR